MASEKAREKRQSKKRPASAGLRKRIGGNHGNGKSTQFKPGENRQNGDVFRLGRDDIPRGSATLMLKTVAHDGRADIYRNLRKLVTKPMGALAFVRGLADRTEGKPTQKHEVAVPRVTVFAPADPADQGASGPPPPPRGAAAAGAPARDGSIRGPNGERLRPFE